MTKPETSMDELQQFCLQKCTDIVKEIGVGFSETVYHNAFMVELRNSPHEWESEKVLSIVYKGIQVGFCKADIVIRGELVLEFKALTRKLGEQDERQVKKYMDICDIKRGLVINFSRVDPSNKQIEFIAI